MLRCRSTATHQTPDIQFHRLHLRYEPIADPSLVRNMMSARGMSRMEGEVGSAREAPTGAKPIDVSFWGPPPESGPSYVKSFGCRLASESLRRTNPRLGGKACQDYGDLRIWLFPDGQLRRFPGCPGAACRWLCRTIGAQIRSHTRLESTTTIGVDRPNGSGEPVSTQGADGRSHMATTRRGYEPCRVTASPSRMVWNKPVARAVGPHEGTSR
jgi:hypothetical protein